jgi:hypothetical protein
VGKKKPKRPKKYQTKRVSFMITEQRMSLEEVKEIRKEYSK